MQEEGIIEQSTRPYASPQKQKQHFVSPLILGHPDFNNPFIDYTDASNMCLSDVFSQQTGLGTEQVLADTTYLPFFSF